MPADPAAVPAVSPAITSEEDLLLISAPASRAGGLEGTPAADGRRSLFHGIIAALLLAVLFTLLCVQWSFSRGRLSQDVTYDDSSYLFEAGRRLAVLYDQGLVAYVRNIYRDPPHAPFTDLGAELSFGLFGLHDWVPYVFVNGPVILLLLLAVAYFGRAVSLRARIALMVFALSIPFSVVAMQEYRPDFPGALFTALGIYLVTEAALYRVGPWRERQWIIGGLLFGLALVTKAVFFVHTFTMEGLSIAAACAVVWWTAEAPARWKNLLPRFSGIAARVLLPSLVIWAPYILVNFRETFGYFYDFALGQHSHVSELKGGLGVSAYFYTFGYAGSYMLGGSFYVGMALYAFCLVNIMRWRDGRELFFQGVLLALAVVSLGSIILNHRENHYFGMPSDTLLLFMVVRAVVAVWPRFCVTRWRKAGGLAVLACLGAVNFSLLNPAVLWPYSIPQLNYVVYRGHSLNQRILDDIWRELGPRAALPVAPPTTFVTRGGFVTAPTFRWLAMKAGRRLAFSDVFTDEDPETSRKLLEAATFVVAPEDNAAGVYNQNASYNLRFEVEHMIAANQNLRLLRRYPDSPGGPAFRLFVNDAKMSEQFGSFGGFEALEGFLPWEGPYPESELGKIRWATGASSRFTLMADAPGDAMLRMSVRADQPIRATVSQGGKPVLTIATPQRPGFQAFTAPVKVQAGANEFVLACENELLPPAPDGYQRTLLFRQLEIVTVEHAP